MRPRENLPSSSSSPKGLRQKRWASRHREPSTPSGLPCGWQGISGCPLQRELAASWTCRCSANSAAGIDSPRWLFTLCGKANMKPFIAIIKPKPMPQGRRGGFSHRITAQTAGRPGGRGAEARDEQEAVEEVLQRTHQGVYRGWTFPNRGRVGCVTNCAFNLNFPLKFSLFFFFFNILFLLKKQI